MALEEPIRRRLSLLPRPTSRRSAATSRRRRATAPALDAAASSRRSRPRETRAARGGSPRGATSRSRLRRARIDVGPARLASGTEHDGAAGSLRAARAEALVPAAIPSRRHEPGGDRSRGRAPDRKTRQPGPDAGVEFRGRAGAPHPSLPFRTKLRDRHAADEAERCAARGGERGREGGLLEISDEPAPAGRSAGSRGGRASKRGLPEVLSPAAEDEASSTRPGTS